MKVSDAYLPDKIIEAAKLDGWWQDPKLGWWHPVKGQLSIGFREAGLPEYSTDFQPIMTLIQKQDDATLTRICLHLTKAQNNVARCFDWLKSQPHQLLDGLLVARGIYEA